MPRSSLRVEEPEARARALLALADPDLTDPAVLTAALELLHDTTHVQIEGAEPGEPEIHVETAVPMPGRPLASLAREHLGALSIPGTKSTLRAMLAVIEGHSGSPIELARLAGQVDWEDEAEAMRALADDLVGRGAWALVEGRTSEGLRPIWVVAWAAPRSAPLLHALVQTTRDREIGLDVLEELLEVDGIGIDVGLLQWIHRIAQRGVADRPVAILRRLAEDTPIALGFAALTDPDSCAAFEAWLDTGPEGMEAELRALANELDDLMLLPAPFPLAQVLERLDPSVACRVVRKLEIWGPSVRAVLRSIVLQWWMQAEDDRTGWDAWGLLLRSGVENPELVKRGLDRLASALPDRLPTVLDDLLGADPPVADLVDRLEDVLIRFPRRARELVSAIEEAVEAGYDADLRFLIGRYLRAADQAPEVVTPGKAGRYRHRKGFQVEALQPLVKRLESDDPLRREVERLSPVRLD